MRSQYRLNSSLIFWWKKIHLKKPKSEGSVKNFVFPTHFKQDTSAVSRLPVNNAGLCYPVFQRYEPLTTRAVFFRRYSYSAPEKIRS